MAGRCTYVPCQSVVDVIHYVITVDARYRLLPLFCTFTMYLIVTVN